MKSFKTFAVERLEDGEVKTFFIKNVGGIYIWTTSTCGYTDINTIPEDIKLIDFSEEIEGKKPYPVIIFTVPAQTLIRSL